MYVSGKFKIPKLLRRLIAKGIWPGESEKEGKWVTTLVGKKKINAFAPGESELYLFQPPFKTIADRISDKKNADYWTSVCTSDQINPDYFVLIADFGIGADTFIALDYRYNNFAPAVWRSFRENEKFGWEIIADNFEDFCALLGWA